MTTVIPRKRMDTALANALEQEITRVTTQMLPIYRRTNGVSLLIEAYVQQDVDDATEAQMSGNIADMLRFLKLLREYA